MCSDKNGSDSKYSKMDTGVSAEMIQGTLDIIDVLTPHRKTDRFYSHIVL